MQKESVKNWKWLLLGRWEVGVGRGEGAVVFLTKPCRIIGSFIGTCKLGKMWTESKIWESLAFFLVTSSV